MIKRFFALLSLVLATSASADSVDDAIDRVQTQIAVAKSQLTEQRATITKKRSELLQLLAEQDEITRELSSGYKGQENQLEKLENSYFKEDSRRSRTSARIKRCRQLLIEARKDVQLPVQKVIPTTNAFNDIDNLIASSDTGPEAIASGLTKILKAHLSQPHLLIKSETMVLKPDGKKVAATAYILSGISSYTVEGDRVGILEPNATEMCYNLHPTLLPRAMANAVKDAIAADSDMMLLPIDVTGGRGLSRLESKKDFIGFLKAGGPVVIPLLVIAVIAFIMVIERFFYLLRVDKNVDNMLGRVLPYLENADYDGALSTVGNSHGPVSNIIQSAVSHGRQKADKLEELLQEAILSELPSLERFLGALAVMAAAAPLLGLLGTVSGMIGTFEVISTYGTGNAKLLSGGISEALITTEIGLIVAVPILLAHAWLNRQVRTLVGHMDRAAISLASAIRQKKGRE